MTTYQGSLSMVQMETIVWSHCGKKHVYTEEIHDRTMYVRVFAGLGRAFVLTPCTLLLGEYFDKRRSLAFGLASAGFGIGGFAITPLIEVVFQEYGFTGTFIILSGFACNLFICVAFFRSVSSTTKELMIKEKRYICIYYIYVQLYILLKLV